MGAEAGPPRAGRPRRPGGPPPPAPPLLSGRRPRGRTPRWTSRASRLPLELPPLRREFPGLLLNCNFECSSGRCLRFLPVPHFPRPRPANEGAPQQQSRAAARPPAPGPAPRLRAAPAPRCPGSPRPAGRRASALPSQTGLGPACGSSAVLARPPSRGCGGLPPSGALPSSSGGGGCLLRGGADSQPLGSWRERVRCAGSLRQPRSRGRRRGRFQSQRGRRRLRKCPKWDFRMTLSFPYAGFMLPR